MILKGTGGNQGRRRRLFGGLLIVRLHLFVFSFGWDFDSNVLHCVGGSRFESGCLATFLALFGFGRLLLISFLVIIGWKGFNKVRNIARLSSSFSPFVSSSLSLPFS
jgi:hypothetical protein